jgi:hypothetical protein
VPVLKVNQQAFIHTVFATLSAAALLPAIFVGVQVLTCQHSGEHWERLAMLALGPACLIASAIFVPFWVAGLKPVFSIAWSIGAFSILGTTILSCVW